MCYNLFDRSHAHVKTYLADLCDPNPCQNLGTCTAGICNCAEGFSGDLCEKGNSPCLSADWIIVNDRCYLTSSTEMNWAQAQQVRRDVVGKAKYGLS